jgi:formylglycine-generating enzyme required for sulfatase activity
MSGQITINHLTEISTQWLAEGIPIDPEALVWVTIDNDPNFFGQISKYETTNAQYCHYLNTALLDGLITVYSNTVYATSDTSYSEPYFKTYEDSIFSQITYSGSTFSVLSRDGFSMADHPVVMITWYGATAFCDNYGYRLPTEWEWQAVADFDGSFTYGCGTTIDQSKANYYDNAYANPLGLNNYPFTSPVGYYPATGYGICDLAGNVWEWTSSTYNDTFRIRRGGGWSFTEEYCSVSNRSAIAPANSYSSLGFRVCR